MVDPRVMHVMLAEDYEVMIKCALSPVSVVMLISIGGNAFISYPKTLNTLL